MKDRKSRIRICLLTGLCDFTVYLDDLVSCGLKAEESERKETYLYPFKPNMTSRIISKVLSNKVFGACSLSQPGPLRLSTICSAEVDKLASDQLIVVETSVSR